jgi:hypothetical protein
MLPVLFWLHCAVLVYDPRPPEQRGHRSPAGRTRYDVRRMR